MKQMTAENHIADQLVLDTAEVIKVKNGLPEIIDTGRETLTVQLVSHHLPYLQPGQRVVFSRLSEAVMVLYLIHQVDDHKPAYHAIQPDSETVLIEAGSTSITLDSKNGICFKVGQSQINLDKQGNLISQADQIHLKAKKNITLSAPGNQLHLSTEE